MAANGSSKANVIVRVRPPFQEEVVHWNLDGRRSYYSAVAPAGIHPGDHPNTSSPPNADVLHKIVHCTVPGERRRAFQFDHVLGPGVGQAEVYGTAAAGIVQRVAGGAGSGAVIAYGQTGSATAEAPLGDDDGIVARAICDTLQHGPMVMVMLQLYADAVEDLLAPGSGPLEVREDPQKGFFVAGAAEYMVHTTQEALMLNAQSSRSHTLLRLSLAPCDGTADPPELFLVDLAGSERLKKGGRGATGARLRESLAINRSLSALGSVIGALARDSGQAAASRFVPFRDSKLTRILQPALGGGTGGWAGAVFIATVGPAPQNSAESLSTLVFAERCSRVRHRPRARPRSKLDAAKAQLDAQQAHVRVLEEALAAQSGHYQAIISSLSTELAQAQADAEDLREALSCTSPLSMLSPLAGGGPPGGGMWSQDEGGYLRTSSCGSASYEDSDCRTSECDYDSGDARDSDGDEAFSQLDALDALVAESISDQRVARFDGDERESESRVDERQRCWGQPGRG
ncbi:P-loop containing nucleoside triphosphate hydrolase protein [Tribonema minus]|uniref:P-loop containing nucleoside triphosphate hydrolase protein n=1 Tax=Tribonema minus TaxID=303371 RepID=A0A836C8W8_9STRA|nr:P-loop containing nucleoside triphosphate hydrolase protein [Tribonema minus]